MAHGSFSAPHSQLLISVAADDTNASSQTSEIAGEGMAEPAMPSSVKAPPVLATHHVDYKWTIEWTVLLWRQGR